MKEENKSYNNDDLAVIIPIWTVAAMLQDGGCLLCTGWLEVEALEDDVQGLRRKGGHKICPDKICVFGQ